MIVIYPPPVATNAALESGNLLVNGQRLDRLIDLQTQQLGMLQVIAWQLAVISGQAVEPSSFFNEQTLQ